MEKMQGKYLTPAEAAEEMCVHTNTLRRWTKNRFLNSFRIGPRGDRRFREDEIDNPTHANLTTAEAARILYVHPNTLRRWNDKGYINSFRIGPRQDRRFSRKEIDNFMRTDPHYPLNP